jgi:O-methyltransferase involved in polyketide biosynthesis
MSSAAPRHDADDVDLLIDRAHSGRAYDYLMGGKDNYPADRAIGEAAAAAWPAVRLAVRANRAFMHRAARYAAGQGIRQFLDVGTGIPTQPNLHQVVQGVAPESRVLYVDNDPIVLAHAAALMVGDPRGRTEYMQADARDPDALLAAVHDRVDVAEPVSVSVIGLLHFLSDDVAVRLVRTLIDAVPSGSFLALTNITRELDPKTIDGAALGYAGGGVETFLRGRAEIEELFLAGLEPVDPGVVIVHRWRPEPDAVAEDGTRIADVPDAEISVYGAVARKP